SDSTLVVCPHQIHATDTARSHGHPHLAIPPLFLFFFFNNTATTEIYTFPYTTLFRSEGYQVLICKEGNRAYEFVKQQQPDQLVRSEEHTSELQSLAYLVCRLLLEKKKKKTS